MSLKTLVSLLVALGLFAGVAYFMNKKPAARVTVGGVTAGDKAFAELDVNAINGVELATATETVRLVRATAGWTVENLHSYPAQFSSIAGFLRKLNDLKVSQVMREGEATFAELGLDEASLSSDRLAVKLTYEGGTSPVTFTLGANKQPRDASPMGMNFSQARFMRIADGPALQVDEVFMDLGRRPEDWIERQLFKVNAADVAKVEVKREDGEYVISKKDDGSYELSGLEASQTVDANAASSLFQGMQWMQFDSVVDPAATDESVGLHAFDTVSYTSTNGVVRTLEISRTEDTGTRALRISYSDISEGGANAAEVAQLKEKHGSWRFKVQAGVLSQLMPARDSLISKPAEAVSEAPASEPSSDVVEPPMPE